MKRGLQGIHYGWLIVLAGHLCLFACLGLGRFALGMLLPAMSSSLGLSYSQMGVISTSNFLGYLGAVLVSGYAARRFGARRIIFLALMLVCLSMALVAGADRYQTVLALYLLTGIGSGAANVPMMGLVSSWFRSGARGRAAGFIVSGSGFAILLSGWLFPRVNALGGPEGWRSNWIISAVLVGGIAIFSLLALRNSPQEVGHEPFGSERGGAEGAAGPFRPAGASVILRLGGIYFLFGFTYVIYVTFIVTFLVREHGYSEAVAGYFWSAVGLLSLLSGPVFGTLSDRWGRRNGLIVVFCIQTAAYLLAASGRGGVFLYVSVALFGIVAWSIPSIMAALTGDHVGPERAAQVFGVITFIFGIGQTAGPALAGRLADITGSFRSSFALAAAMTMVAALLTGLSQAGGRKRSG